MNWMILFQIFSVAYGQVYLPMGTRIRCFGSLDCSSNTELSDMTTQSSSSLNECCITDTEGSLSLNDESNMRSFRLNNGECRPCSHSSVIIPREVFYECYDNECSGDYTNNGISDGGGQINHICCGSTATTSDYFSVSGGECIPCYSLTSSGMGNDPHFLLPLPNGDQLCFSIQGQPNFAFSLISDKYIQLNGQFVLPAPEESHTIANVSTFLGDIGLVIKNPISGNVTIIKVSAQDHSVTVGNGLTIIKDRPVTVDVFDKVQITVDTKAEANVLKDASTWLYINTEGFGIKVEFYKKHLNMFMTKTSGLTKEANGLIGQFFTPNVTVDEDAQFIRLNDGDPIPAKKAPIWPFMGISGDCWYGTATDNQGTGVIKGDYTEYIVEHLVAPTNN